MEEKKYPSYVDLSDPAEKQFYDRGDIGLLMEYKEEKAGYDNRPLLEGDTIFYITVGTIFMFWFWLFIYKNVEVSDIIYVNMTWLLSWFILHLISKNKKIKWFPTFVYTNIVFYITKNPEYVFAATIVYVLISWLYRLKK